MLWNSKNCINIYNNAAQTGNRHITQIDDNGHNPRVLFPITDCLLNPKLTNVKASASKCNDFALFFNTNITKILSHFITPKLPIVDSLFNSKTLWIVLKRLMRQNFTKRCHPAKFLYLCYRSYSKPGTFSHTPKAAVVRSLIEET